MGYRYHSAAVFYPAYTTTYNKKYIIKYKYKCIIAIVFNKVAVSQFFYWLIKVIVGNKLAPSRKGTTLAPKQHSKVIAMREKH